MTQFSNPDMQDLADHWPLYKELKLPPQASIIIVGAYKGRLIKFLLEAFPDIANILGYEPQVWARSIARNHFYSDESVVLFPFGLATESSTDTPLYGYETDECSMLPGTGRAHQRGMGNFIDAKAFSYECDLLIMNIEGYEWTLLPYMLKHGLLDKAKSLAVQFHSFAAPREDIRADLWQLIGTRYALLAYEDYPSWVYWRA